MQKAKFKRVLIKVSGEALAGSQGFGIDPATVEWLSKEVKQLVDEFDMDLAFVIGGGNFMRGTLASQQGMERVTADYMGMLATVINALGVQDMLEKFGVPTRVQSAIKMDKLCETFIRRKAIRHLEKRRVVIFAGGTGNPYFSTDTAAVLRAIEINADVIMKATKVDGIYDSDPVKNADAKLLKQISFLDVLNRQLKVMDTTAISLCMENNLPIRIFKLMEKGNLRKVVAGDDTIGSTVS